MPRRSGVNITQHRAETAKPGLLWDREVPGFGLRVLATGARTWVFKYRLPDGRQRWLRFGSFPSLPASDARKHARKLRVAVDFGGDPADERQQQEKPQTLQAAASESPAPRLAVLVDAYAKALPGRPSMRRAGAISERHARAESAAVRAALTRMEAGERSADKLRASDVVALMRAEAARPATARLLFGALSRFMEWCREEGHASANPCDDVPRSKRPRMPAARSRVVALPDLARLWHAATALPDVLRDLARFLIAVPVRRGEGARMDWRDVDLKGGVWTLPGVITKNGDPHRIALPALVVVVLRARHRAGKEPRGGLVFPSLKAAAPVQNWSDMKATLAEAADFTAWTWHDFRRSFASLMAERGVAEPVADAVLNHRQSSTRGGVLGVYQHARRWPEQAAAMHAWGEALTAAIKASRRKPRRPSGPQVARPAGLARRAAR